MNLYFLIQFINVIIVQSQHAWHFLNTSKPVDCQLSNILEQSASFVDFHNQPITNFTVENNFTFAMNINSHASFNMIYSVACVYQNQKPPCDRCVFQISALGPQNPNIFIINYGNITCEWAFTENQTIISMYIFL